MSGGMENVGKSVPLDWSAGRSESSSEAEKVAEKDAFGTRETKSQKKKGGGFLARRAAERRQSPTSLDQRTPSHAKAESYFNKHRDSIDSGIGDMDSDFSSAREFSENVEHAQSFDKLEDLREQLRDDRENYSEEQYSMLKQSIYDRAESIVEGEMDYIDELSSEDIADIKVTITRMFPDIKTEDRLMQRFNQLQALYHGK